MNGFIGERIIVPLDRHFVVYPRGAGVDEVLHWSTSTRGRVAGVEEAGVEEVSLALV